MSITRGVLRWAALSLLMCGHLQAQVAQVAKPDQTARATERQDFAKGDDDAYRPQPLERNPRYRINRSDVLVITFPLSPEFNQKVTVEPDGYITLQGAGSINILGLTVPQTVQTIKAAYANTLNHPMVDVDLIDFQKAYFIVTGQVNKPGQYDLRYDLTVSEAIALAGGFMPTAKTKVYLYRRAESGWVEAKELKLSDFLHGKDVNEDVGVRSGDMIFVPEKTITKIRKYIPYGVPMPAFYY